MTTPTESDSEYVVLCGQDDECIGYARKADVHHTTTPLHLAFSSYVFDTTGRFLVTHRALSKRTWPGVRTNSCCGHPGPQEPVGDAVARRLATELGLVPDRIELVVPAFRYRATMPSGIRENELCPVYRVVVPPNVSIRPNPEEVQDVAWVDWAEFVGTVQGDPETVSPWCASQVRVLAQLGPDPLAWPVADDAELPLAAREPLGDGGNGRCQQNRTA